MELMCINDASDGWWPRYHQSYSGLADVTNEGRIPPEVTRPCELSSGCQRTFQNSSLPRIGSQEALISTH
ncbi:unnamed protein product [Nezara viridula]|uniref:Uncharacterized protein n=1 Tax=Nezara viridula TaxID=85310 RepID=A0A9P0MP46_NEZVI|nr:unnamed protein product [Nezara viridula]